MAGLGIAISDARGFCYSLQPAAEKKGKKHIDGGFSSVSNLELRCCFASYKQKYLITQLFLLVPTPYSGVIAIP